MPGGQAEKEGDRSVNTGSKKTMVLRVHGHLKRSRRDGTKGRTQVLGEDCT